jgi:hypothetical protein
MEHLPASCFGVYASPDARLSSVATAAERHSRLMMNCAGGSSGKLAEKVRNLVDGRILQSVVADVFIMAG